MSLDAIDAVDWSAIPNPTQRSYDDPERVARALRLLAVSTTANETGDAAALLAGGGFVCGHAGMVFPAAHAATPALLDLVEHGRRPRVKDAALGLLSEALDSFPPAGYTRVDTPYGAGVPLCCAIARLIRGRRGALLAHGRYGKHVLGEADLHWRLTVEETELQPGDGPTGIAALAVLEGTAFRTPVEAELHTPPSGHPAPTVRIDALTADASGAAWVHLTDTPPDPAPGSALYPAECGRLKH
ncbi:hypothetical protein [Streptomyces chromofuscus]|uniref:Uncharacterized protein n=1 Tax=Streptomyces chromofuscus TaxID=42881 RepID=A0A7M2TFG8_STRCW|nr:hypothetical protein [Streptomyces chromofuscus]QOV47222.1 hypothetical protein IPT68_15900 [Streptomyces chromofuscus]GGT24262.1 hypothetical protein GCM10010254_50830 [Streptomyces chromofuscus]